MAVYGQGNGICIHEAELIDPCDPEVALETYGALYNYFSCIDSRALCPTGWHVSHQDDWAALLDVAWAASNIGTGDALKATQGWSPTEIGENGNGQDLLGFGALPGGWRSHYAGDFSLAGARAWFWAPGPGCRVRYMDKNSTSVLPNCSNHHDGNSVRCVQDE